MNWLVVVAAFVIGISAGFMICSVLTLGRQDDIMHALAMLLERPTDPNMRENARKVLRG